MGKVLIRKRGFMLPLFVEEQKMDIVRSSICQNLNMCSRKGAGWRLTG